MYYKNALPYVMGVLLTKAYYFLRHYKVLAIASLLSISKFKVDSSLKRPYLAGHKALSQTNKEIDAGFRPNLKGIL